MITRVFSALRTARACVFLSGLILVVLAGERARVTVLSTTDMHGHIFPVDYFTGKTDELGLAKVATLIARERKDAPTALLLDVGDTIQGSPLSYLHARKYPGLPEPMMLVMNHLHYDAMTIGNHEFNFGREVLEKARHEAAFPWLSANSIDTRTGKPEFTPYVIKEVTGVRVGIIGITTAGIPYWEDAKNIENLRFEDPTKTAARYVAELRNSGKVDVIIVTMHMGLEEELSTGATPPGQTPLENAALAIARTVPGIDLILMGHTHRLIPALVVNGVMMVQAGRWSDNLIRADLYLEKDDNGKWGLVGKAAKNIPVTAQVKADPEVIAMTQEYENRTQAWLSRTIGHSASELTASDSRRQDSAVIDLIQRVQLEAGEADVSFAASFNLEARVPAGAVTVRDIYSLYTYENTLLVVEATGAQIKEALEHSALYFKPHVKGASLDALVDNRIPGYNFDAAEGLSYSIDLSRPQGDRIMNLSFEGKPLDPSRKLRVALNNYRYNGGGGYRMFKDCPVLQRRSQEVRDLIMEWVEKHQEIPSSPTNNWKIILP